MEPDGTHVGPQDMQSTIAVRLLGISTPVTIINFDFDVATAEINAANKLADFLGEVGKFEAPYKDERVDLGSGVAQIYPGMPSGINPMRYAFIGDRAAYEQFCESKGLTPTPFSTSIAKRLGGSRGVYEDCAWIDNKLRSGVQGTTVVIGVGGEWALEDDDVREWLYEWNTVVNWIVGDEGVPDAVTTKSLVRPDDDWIPEEYVT